MADTDDSFYRELSTSTCSTRPEATTRSRAASPSTFSWEAPATITVDGGAGDDIIRGDSGNDTIVGGEGNDIIRGDSGDDSIDGGEGNDTLSGGEGDDWLNGGSGNDSLTGGAGADMFVFEPGHGNDTITDYNDDEDLIDLTALTDITAFSDLTITASGNDVSIDLSSQGGGYIQIENTAASDLDEEDFCFYEAPSDGDAI